MEMFNIKRRDIHTFDDYMDLKKPAFGGPSHAEPFKDAKGKRAKKDPALNEYQRIVKRAKKGENNDIFTNQVYDPTYKAMGGDLIHKQEYGENPYDYEDTYDNMGIATVERGDKDDDKPKYGEVHTNEGMCYEDFASFVLESSAYDHPEGNSEEGSEDLDESEEVCEDCDD